MSNRVTITISIDLPDGIVPDVDYGMPISEETELREYMQTEPPHVAETFQQFGSSTGSAEAVRYDRDATAAPVAVLPAPGNGPICTVHNQPMKRYPAGVSKGSGKPYNASWRCSANGCTTKPIWDRDAVPVPA